MPSAIHHDELLDWIRLAATPGIGPIAFRELIRRSGTAGEALRRLPDYAARGGKRKIEAPSRGDAEKTLEKALKQGISPIITEAPDYPARLRHIEDPPPILWVKGQIAVLSGPCIAVVGARNASLGGKKIAKAWSTELAAAGLAVVSGLARGVDGAAHEGALASGKTVAVMAGGVDVIYPQEHRTLWKSVADHGAVVSEMPPGTEPLPPLFPRRNRVISGLSVAVVVVEATEKSGSLITARFAADQGRDVYAVPGSPLEPRAAGPNRLIRDGAPLVQSTVDILEAMGPIGGPATPVPQSPAQAIQPAEINDEKSTDQVRGLILRQLGPDPVAVDELVRQCQTSAPVLAQALLELELAGRVVRLPGNRVASTGSG